MASGAGRFVGRRRELAEIMSLLERAFAGSGSVVVLSGEGGIGKTRLCEELAVAAREQGAGVAWAACWESGGLPPFWPWRQLIDQLGTTFAATAPVFSAPGFARAELFASMANAVRAAAGTRPRLLVVDDAQWADPATVQSLAHLAPSLRSIAALLVVTVREAENAHASLLPGLRRHGQTVHLGGLKTAELGELVEALTGSRPDASESASLHRVTGGNPLFASELVRRLDDRGLPGLAGDDTVPIPPTVRAVLDERLAGLPGPCRDTLAIGALIGAEFPVDLVAGAAGRSGLDVIEVLHDAVRARVIEPRGVGHYAFSHPLLRSVLSDDTGLAQKVRLHLRIAQWLEAAAAQRDDIDLAALSFHYLNAAPAGTGGKAATFAQLAAEAAMSALGYEDAVRLYDRALTATELEPGTSDRLALLLGAGEARAACGDVGGARRDFLAAAEQARRAGRSPELAAAALGLAGSGFEVPLFDAEQIALLEEALAATSGDAVAKGVPAAAREGALAGASDGRPALRSRLCARLSVALSLSGQDGRRAALSEEAVRLAERSADPAALAQALAARCDADAGPAQVARRAADAARIVRLAVERSDRATELLGRRLRLLAALELGDVAAVDAEIQAFAQVADALGQPQYQWYVKLWQAMRAVMRGDMTAQRSLAGQADALGRAAGSVNCGILVLAHRWFAWLEAGEIDAALSHMNAHAPPGTYAEMGPQMVPLQAGRPLLAGRPEEARAVLDACAEDLKAAPTDAEWLTMLAQVGDICFRLGGHDLVPWLYDALAPFAAQWSVDGIGAYAHGPVHRQLGLLAVLLGRPADAAAHFDDALAGSSRAGARLLVARTLMDRGIALDEPEALQAAQELYRQLGLGRRAGEAGAALARQEAAGRGSGPVVNEFRRDGDVWKLAFAGRRCSVRDSKGIRDLARLLGQPGREIAALDLATPGPGALVTGAGLGPALDATARAAYKARLAELEGELDDADAKGDLERSRRAQAEREALLEQLSQAYGISGRPRRSGDPAERARTAVTARIRDAIRRISELHPQLGRHLSRSVRTGTFCSYDPDPPVTWEL